MSTATKKAPTHKTPSKTQVQGGGGDMKNRVKVPITTFVEAVFEAMGEPGYQYSSIAAKLNGKGYPVKEQAISARFAKLIEQGRLTEEDKPERKRGLSPTQVAELEEKIAKLREQAKRNLKKAG